jgi:hypothetical protein
MQPLLLSEQPHAELRAPLPSMVLLLLVACVLRQQYH